MDTLGIIAIIFAVLGIAGSVLPFLPGPPFSWLALLCVYFSSSATSPMETSSLLYWLIPTVTICLVDIFLPGLFARFHGGHKAAGHGATIGMFAGMVYRPLGLLFGTFIGAFLGELLFGKTGYKTSFKAAVGAFASYFIAILIKLVFSSIVLGQVLAHLW